MIDKSDRIFVAGHQGMVGRAVWDKLIEQGYTNLVGISHQDLDLKNQSEVRVFINENRPNLIINAAAKVGGILANSTKPFDFISDNLLIQSNLISTAVEFRIPGFVFLGSSCIYPRLAQNPINETQLLTGSLETTNEWYAISKIAGLKTCEAARIQFGLDYFSVMPTNLYGPFDNFDLSTSHVLPALIRKFHESKDENNSVSLWGNGEALREFLHVHDLAESIIFLLNSKRLHSIYNVGSGEEISIRELSQMVCNKINSNARIEWDINKPNGTPKKLLDSSRIKSMGWKPKIELSQGIDQTYDWFLNNHNQK
jgi:GDP-L-fucose synthase